MARRSAASPREGPRAAEFANVPTHATPSASRASRGAEFLTAVSGNSATGPLRSRRPGNEPGNEGAKDHRRGHPQRRRDVRPGLDLSVAAGLSGRHDLLAGTAPFADAIVGRIIVPGRGAGYAKTFAQIPPCVRFLLNKRFSQKNYRKVGQKWTARRVARGPFCFPDFAPERIQRNGDWHGLPRAFNRSRATVCRF